MLTQNLCLRVAEIFFFHFYDENHLVTARKKYIGVEELHHGKGH